MGAPVFCLPFRFLDTGPSALDLTMRDGPDCAERSTLLIGIDAPGYQAALTTVLSTGVWDHARERAPGGCTIGFSAYLPARMGPLILLQRSVPCLVSPADRGLVC
jgi:hypothetical protein